MSSSLPPHGLQLTRLPCPSPTPRAYSDSCAWSWWCHPTISSFVILFSSCLKSFLVWVFSNGSVLHIRWPKYWNFSFSISPSNEYSGLISIGWTGLISLQSKGLSRAFNTTVRKHQFLALSLLYSPTLTYICDYWKNYSLPIWIFVGKVMSLVFTML